MAAEWVAERAVAAADWGWAELAAGWGLEDSGWAALVAAEETGWGSEAAAGWGSEAEGGGAAAAAAIWNEAAAASGLEAAGSGEAEATLGVAGGAAAAIGGSFCLPAPTRQPRRL